MTTIYSHANTCQSMTLSLRIPETSLHYSVDHSKPFEPAHLQLALLHNIIPFLLDPASYMCLIKALLLWVSCSPNPAGQALHSIMPFSENAAVAAATFGLAFARGTRYISCPSNSRNHLYCGDFVSLTSFAGPSGFAIAGIRSGF